MLDEIKKLRFTPDWGEARLQGMVENRPDWCVSVSYTHLMCIRDRRYDQAFRELYRDFPRELWDWPGQRIALSA